MGSFGDCFLDHFRIRLVMLQKRNTSATCLILGVLGHHFNIIVANSLKDFVALQSRLHFFSDLIRFWPPEGVPIGINFRKRSGICIEKSVLKFRLEQINAWALISKSRKGGAEPV